jgi:hypothetical protein
VAGEASKGIEQFYLQRWSNDGSSRLRSKAEMTLMQIGKDGFSLPIKLVTSTEAILARTRSGKSCTASVQAGELLRDKQQIAAIELVLAAVESRTENRHVSAKPNRGLA